MKPRPSSDPSKSRADLLQWGALGAIAAIITLALVLAGYACSVFQGQVDRLDARLTKMEDAQQGASASGVRILPEQQTPVPSLTPTPEPTPTPMPTPTPTAMPTPTPTAMPTPVEAPKHVGVSGRIGVSYEDQPLFCAGYGKYRRDMLVIAVALSLLDELPCGTAVRACNGGASPILCEDLEVATVFADPAGFDPDRADAWKFNLADDVADRLQTGGRATITVEVLSR